VKDSIAGIRPKPVTEGQVSTSMPGNIVEVLVKEGDEVSIGQPILVTEAMKMETEVQSPIAGIVKKVYVQSGDAVSPDETLVEIENGT
jgi:pyruvate carboxylase subunit B